MPEISHNKSSPRECNDELKDGIYFTIDDGRHVFTAAYLLSRGTCCGSGCRNCPYRESKLTPIPPAPE